MLESHIHRWFKAQGRFCAERPFLVIVLAALMAVQCLLGFKHFRIEEKPESLWVEPTSRTALDMSFFNAAFKPFYRVEEVIVTSKSDPGSNVLTNEGMIELMQFIDAVSVTKDPATDVSLQDLCWHPIQGKGCFMQSVLGYLQNNLTQVINASQSPNGVAMAIGLCVQNPLHQTCYSDLGLPIEHTTVLGKEVFNWSTNALEAGAALTTFLLENSNDANYIATARSWEENVFLALAKNFSESSATLRVDYMAQRSIQDALDSQNKASIANVGISYAVMLTYIAVALGYWSKVHSKGLVALVGIVIVGVSIAVSIGFCSAIDIPLTLIITDVIPFLLVAIGVDNMFIISNQFWFRCRVHQRQVHRPLTREQIAQAMSEALGEVGGTIFLAGASEGFAFSLGALTEMPAVRAFCLYSGVAILCNLMMQVTVFVAVLSLDARRAADRRYDFLPCFQYEQDKDDYENPIVEQGVDDPDSPLVQRRETNEIQISFYDSVTARETTMTMSVAEYVKHRENTRDGGLLGLGRLVRTVIRRFYVPVILNRVVQIVVVLGFILFSAMCLVFVCPNVKLGLKQSDPVPDDSYLRSMFLTMEEYLEVGPLIYFATPMNRDAPLVNWSDTRVLQPMQQISDELRDVTAYIDSATIASWFQDFNHWVCYNSQHMEGNINDGKGCIDLGALNITDADAIFNCTADARAQSMPFDMFTLLLKQFLATQQCCHQIGGTNTGLCGFQYGQEVIFGDVYVDAEGHIRAVPDGEFHPNSFEYVRFSRVRAQTIRLSTNKEYIASLASSYNFTDTINQAAAFQEAGISLFPYSIYFVYYSQYLNLASNASLDVGVAMLAVIATTFVVLSSLSSTVSVALSLVLILIDLVAVMAWWEIDVNAISVVNMVMCVGISVEFCAHIAVAFCGAKGTIRKRMMVTMVDMGSNVFMGITVTKLLGVSILNFSPSRVFRVYYFRMYVTIIIFGALHGLVFLPCLLMLIGAPFRGRDAKKERSLSSL